MSWIDFKISDLDLDLQLQIGLFFEHLNVLDGFENLKIFKVKLAFQLTKFWIELLKIEPYRILPVTLNYSLTLTFKVKLALKLAKCLFEIFILPCLEFYLYT